MYKPASARVMLDRLDHMRSLYRKLRPANNDDWIVQRERESFTRILAGNIRQGRHQPTLHTIFQMKRHFRLSMDGAHRFFGFRLERIQSFDFRFNAARTRFIDSYRFNRHRRVDLPLRLDERAFFRPALMREGVSSWQHGVPVRQLERENWFPRHVRYAQIGFEDSVSSPLPTGAIVVVHPVSEEELHSPDPTGIYMLQFGNGYRCCGYSIRGRRVTLTPYRAEGMASVDFVLNQNVRVIGRIEGFALRLPRRRLHGVSHDLPVLHKSAPLIVPWTQPSLRKLFAAGEVRLHRPHGYWRKALPLLEEELGTHISERTIRRYSEDEAIDDGMLPLVGKLIGLAIRFGASYSDVLRLLSYLIDFEEGLYSLEELLRVKNLEELEDVTHGLEAAYPEQLWLQLLGELGNWSALMPNFFPALSSFQNRVIRVQHGEDFQGPFPMLSAGSWLLLNRTSEWIDDSRYEDEIAWERPLYVLRKDRRLFCGHIRRDDVRWYLTTQSHNRRVFTPIPARELRELRRVEGVVVRLAG